MSSWIADSIAAMASSWLANFFLDGCFQLIESSCQFFGWRPEARATARRPDDENGHLHSAWAIEHGGSHDGAMFCEGVGQEFDVLAAAD